MKKVLAIIAVALASVTLGGYIWYQCTDLQAAKAYIRYANYIGAVPKLERALAKDPGSAEARLYLALAYAKMNKLDQARREFESVEKELSSVSVSADIYNDFGLMYYVHESYERAIELFRKAIAVNPKYVEAYYNLGTSYSALGRVTDAIKSYQAVVDLDHRHSYGNWNLAVNLEKSGDVAGAIKYWRRYLEFTPGMFRQPDTEAHIEELEKSLKTSRR